MLTLTINPNNPDFDFWEFVKEYLAAGFNPLGPQGSSNPEYKTLEAYLRHLFGDLPEGAVDWASSDLNGDGFNDLYAIDADGNPHTVYGNDSDGNTESTEFNEWQYNSFIDEFEEVLSSEDPSSGAQELFERYENYGIADNTFIQNSFSFVNPQQIIDRAILGDSDIGVKVDICSSTVTTNCVDPKAINDLWEDFGRHIQVIFKGLQIPGLPEWLPLPGIMSLPTIGEIWDKITGPFNDAARDQLRDCMSKDDDGDGVANTASYCMENRDIAGIITQGILDGTDDIIDATQEAVKGIVDKALETLDCVTAPAACASKIKGILEGVLGGADPTQPGLPDWMRVIIIGSQYGDKILKELEKLFNQDIDGDGTIGITATEDYDCSQAGREQVGGATTANDCGACTEVAEDNTPFEVNPTTGFCEDPTIDDPSLTEQEQLCKNTGRKYDDLNDICLEECDNPQYKIGADGACEPPDSVEQCTDPHREKNEDGSCGVKCTDGSDAVDGTPCPDSSATPTGPDGIKCEDGYPEGALTFALQDQQIWWKGNCKDTHCNDGTKIPEDGVCEGEGGNGTDGGNGDDLCDDGSEPFYINFDDDKDGAFTDPRDGKSYTYDPCDQTQPPVEVDPEDNDTDNGNGFVVKCEEPKLGFTPSFDLELNAAYAEYSAKYDDECGTGGPPVETCSDPNAVNDGQDGPCECKPGFSKDPETLLCVQGTTVCDNGATEESGCEKCPDGSKPSDYEDMMCPSTTVCDNGATEESGCDTCPDGTSVLEYEDGICPSEPPVTPECNDCTCAEYAAANPEECITQPPVTTGGGSSSGGGGGGGMFNPFLAGISYTPQAVPEPPAPPQKDYMAELDNIIKRSLFEGMA